MQLTLQILIIELQLSFFTSNTILSETVASVLAMPPLTRYTGPTIDHDIEHKHDNWSSCLPSNGDNRPDEMLSYCGVVRGLHGTVLVIAVQQSLLYLSNQHQDLVSFGSRDTCSESSANSDIRRYQPL